MRSRGNVPSRSVRRKETTTDISQCLSTVGRNINDPIRAEFLAGTGGRTVSGIRLADYRSPLAALNGENSRAKSRMSVKIARRTGAICCGRVFDPLAPSSWAGV